MSSRRRGGVNGDDPEAPKPSETPSGMPETLYGKIDVKDMGSRAAHESAPVLKKSSATTKKAQLPGALSAFKKGSDVTALNDEFLDLKYKPRTKETRQTFEYLASIVHGLLGADQPHDVTLSAADQVLGALKTGVEEDLERETVSRAIDRKVAVEGIIGPVPSETFMQMVNLVKLINDYQHSTTAIDDGDEEEDDGVAVVFAEEDDEEDGEEYQTIEGDGEEDFVPSFALVKDEPTPAFDEDHIKPADSSTADMINMVDVENAEILNIDSLAFPDVGHTMTNKKCVVPEGAFKRSKPGYEEIHIPAPAPRPLGPEERLVPIEALPVWAQPAFSGVTSLNRIQSRVYPKAFGTDENLLMCAPTGAGKTNVALLTVLREIGKHMSNGQLDLTAFKIVYVAPMKALVQEMVGSFGRRLAPFGINVVELTGDQQTSRAQLESSQVIVTTPEKWDVITRKEQSFSHLVKLVIIDEIHLLHDGRGPVLEALVARVLRGCEETQLWTRLVGLSATLPNYTDVARFLRADKSSTFFFDSSYRPCPLAQEFVGITERNALKRQSLMNQIVYERVAERAGKSQVIVFVHSRKDTERTAKAVRDMAIAAGTITKFPPVDGNVETSNAGLRDLLSYGFAVHHAGMSRPDRNLVESLFAEGRIQVLVSTATLAWGVNLPAHTVIIKGTQVYNPEQGRWAPLSAQDTLQMLGRAGRPQYDTQGEGIIITQHGELQFYLSLLTTQLPIESQLMTRLLDTLNAEVVLGSVGSLKEAAEWIGYSYLAVRMARDPAAYHVPSGLDQKQRRLDICHSALKSLDKAGLVRYDRTGVVQATELGRIASHYYVSQSSMATYNEQLRPHQDLIDLFRIFSLSQEFKLVPIRAEEKAELARLAERVPIPIREAIDEPTAKINVLLQAYISQLALEGFALAADMVYVTQSANRILRAIFELCLRRGWSRLAKTALGLCKLVQQRQWLSQSPLRQIKNGAISSDALRKLEHKDFPFERLFDLNPAELGELIRVPRLGRPLHDQLQMFPRVSLEVQAVPLARDLLRLEIVATPTWTWDESVHGQSETFWLLVEDVDEEHVLHVEQVQFKQRYSNQEHVFTATVPLLDPLPPAYFVSIVSDRWVAADNRQAVLMSGMEKEKGTIQITEVDHDASCSLDLTSIPGLTERYTALGISELNLIQAQVFPALFKSDENVLIGAPSGSGQSLMAELAIARSLAQNPSLKCVYISPHPEMTAFLSDRWANLFQDLLPSGKEVTMLTGDSTMDVKALDRGSIILASPSAWDMISRRWKTRKGVQSVALFIADDLHRLNSEPLLEVCLSRMRYMSAFLLQSPQHQRPVRIVALSVAIASSKDVTAWLGVASACTFNFDLEARPDRLSVQIQGFAPGASMAKSTFKAIKSSRCSLVFVEDRRQARGALASLIGLATAEFVKAGRELPNATLGDDQLAADGLALGLAYVDQGDLSNIELYKRGQAQTLIVTRAALQSLNVHADVVVLQGVSYYHGKEHRHVDYPVADILDMMGRSKQTVLIFCQTSKKTFLKRVLSAPVPLESALDRGLPDVFNAEIVAGTIRSKQDAVDYLTWSYFYRRLAQNPAFYGLKDRSSRHISEHLSSLVEQAVEELSVSKCIEIEEDGLTLSQLNLGIIAAYYNVHHLTIEMFAMSLTATTKLRGVLEIVAAATEYDTISMRQGERQELQAVYEQCPVKAQNSNWNDPHVKTLILLQAHFCRLSLPPALESDQRRILRTALTLVQAIVDVIASHGWLGPALAAMEFSQMIIQAQWDYDSPLKQLPHFTAAVLSQAKELDIETVFDLIDDEKKRSRLMSSIPKAHISGIASAVNKYPNIEVDYQLSPEVASAEASVALVAQLKRDPVDDLSVPASFYPDLKDEAWWLLVGNPSERTLLSIKRVLPKPSQSTVPVSLEFTAPPSSGSVSLKLYLISDCWVGCDQEFDLSLTVH